MQNESPYMRASYSIADVSKFDLAFERLADVIREEKERVAPARGEGGGGGGSEESEESEECRVPRQLPSIVGRFQTAVMSKEK